MGNAVESLSPENASRVVTTVYLSKGYHAEIECWRRNARDSSAEIHVKLCVVSKVCSGRKLHPSEGSFRGSLSPDLCYTTLPDGRAAVSVQQSIRNIPRVIQVSMYARVQYSLMLDI